MPERIHCNGGHKRVLTVAGAGLILATALLASNPAQATIAPRIIPSDIQLPGHPVWHVQVEKPPLQTLLRVYQLVKTNHTPDSVRVTITMYRWRFTLRHGWKPEHYQESAHADKADLPAPGNEVTWKFGGPPIFPDWDCRTGRYFLSESWHGRSSDNRPYAILLYYPYKDGSRYKGDPHSYYGSRPPPRDHSILIKSCRRG